MKKKYLEIIGELEKRNQKKNHYDKIGYIFCFTFIVVFLFLSVGYAAINTKLTISSDVVFRVYEDIRIMDVKILGASNGGLMEYNPNYGKDIVKTGVSLPNLDSTITYEVTVQNLGSTVGTFLKVSKLLYSNANVSYLVNGIEPGDLIQPQTTITFTIVFYYNRTSLPSNRKLDSNLQFSFITKISTMMASNTGTAATDKYNRSDIARNQIESMTFLNTNEVPLDATNSFDFSEKLGEGSVMMWYKDEDGNNLYEVFIGGVNGVYANKNSSYLFNNMTALKELNLTYLNSSMATTLASAFRALTSLKELDLSNFDTTSVLTMANMFYGSNQLTNLDLSNFNTEKVSTMAGLFRDMTNLAEINLSSFNTSNVKSMAQMFQGTTKLETIDLSNFDTENVESFSAMFREARGFKNLDLSHLNTKSATDMSTMFYLAENLEELNISGFDTTNVKNMGHMFRGMPVLRELNVKHFNTSSATTMTYMFEGLKSLKELDLSNFDTKNVEDMAYMFQNCTNMINLDLSSFDTSNVKNMSYMFRDVASLSELNLSSFDTTNVSNMAIMFYGAASLKKLDLSHFNTENVTTMAQMFRNMTSLKELNLSGWDTKKVTTTTYMFAYSNALEILKLEDFTAGQYLTDMSYMFRSMKLKDLYLNNWDFKGTTTNIFVSSSLSGTVYVKNQAAHDFIKGLQPTWNIEIVQ